MIFDMKKLIIILITLLIAFNNPVFSQGITRHFMTNLPQSLHTNPYLFPTYRYSIGFPLSGQWYWETKTNISLNTLISKIENGTLYISPDDIISKLDKVNFVNNEFNLELFSTSFRIKNNFFSVFMTNKTFFEFRYPRDLLSIAWHGNGQFVGGEASFSGLGIDFMNYNELAIGYIRTLKEKLFIGGRLKYLQGLLSVKTSRSDFTLKVDTTTYWLTTNYSATINIAAPFDTNGPSFSSVSDVLNFGNNGLAFDIGAAYKINDKLTASLSVVDLGFIHWTKNTKSYTLEEGKLAFEGLKVDSTFNFNFNDSVLKVIQDTTLENFQITKNTDPFSTAMNSRIYLTASYDLTKNDRFGLLVYNRFSKYYNYMSYSLLYQRMFGNILSLCANYTLTSRGNNKIGTGISLRILGSNFYFMTDDIISIIYPASANTFAFNFGWYYIKSKPKKSAVPKATF